MRVLAIMAVVLATSDARAAPRTLAGDVAYDFVDQYGMGWVTITGKVTVTLTFAGKRGSLRITGKRSWNDGQLAGSKTPGGAPDVQTTKWEGDVDETYPLRAIVRTHGTIAFELEAGSDQLSATCGPKRVDTIARTTLFECSFTGFRWRAVANLPELHHPIVLDSKPGKPRIENALSGASKRGFGRRTVTLPRTPKS